MTVCKCTIIFGELELKMSFNVMQFLFEGSYIAFCVSWVFLWRWSNSVRCFSWYHQQLSDGCS